MGEIEYSVVRGAEPGFQSNYLSPSSQPLFHQILLLLVLVTVTVSSFAQERDVTKWIEIPYPKDTGSVDAILWEDRANYSKYEWRVFLDGRKVCAALTAKSRNGSDEPKFTPKAGRFQSPQITLNVSDGWLVGFNRGEWGGALYWFSKDGVESYKISEHQVVDFVRSGTNIFAAEGLAHMGVSRGSVIKIYQPSDTARWKTSTLAQLQKAPYAVARRNDDTMIVALSDSLLNIKTGGQVETLVKGTHWGLLYPNSIASSEDSKKVFVGMRQFVAEISLPDGTVRFLLPDRSFLSELPREIEEPVRCTYRR